MPSGTVKWFGEDKGYGFITPDGGGKDVFVHHTALDGQRVLQPGARVEFEMFEGRRGPMARNVRVLSRA